MGTPYGWFKRISTRIHVDQIIESFAINCPKLERLGNLQNLIFLLKFQIYHYPKQFAQCIAYD